MDYVSHHPAEHTHNHMRNRNRDRDRRQYDMPGKRPPKTLSPEVNEVLHMLKALESGKPSGTSGH